VGIDRIVFGFAAVHGLQREGMPQDNGNTLVRTEIGQSIPGKQTLDGHDEALAVRGDGLEQGFRCGCHVAVQQDFASVSHDTDVHAPRMQINTTVKGVLVGVESHEVSSSLASVGFPVSAYPSGMLRGEASIIIIRLQATGHSGHPVAGEGLSPVARA
jgi:hypothetical protein